MRKHACIERREPFVLHSVAIIVALVMMSINTYNFIGTIFNQSFCGATIGYIVIILATLDQIICWVTFKMFSIYIRKGVDYVGSFPNKFFSCEVLFK